MLDEAYDMDIGIEQKISLSEIKYLFTSCTLSMESFFSHENFIDDFQEEGEQTIIQQEIVKTWLRKWNPSKMMKYQPIPLPLLKQSMSLFLQHEKRTMRLVAFLFRIPMTPCSMIQKMKEKWKP